MHVTTNHMLADVGVWWGEVLSESPPVAHGMGTFTYGNGDTYYGNYKMDSKMGFGEYKFKNGNSYQGGWKDGKHHGFGSYSDAQSNIVYEGYVLLS